MARIDTEDDLADLALATARVLTDQGERVSLDDVLARFSYTREQLRALPDTEDAPYGR